jgi:RimJ/RimL family protein N-acetyltransferase
MGDNDVMKYVDGIEPFKTINDAEDFIRLFERNEKNVQSYMLGIEHQENGLIGMIGYDYVDEDEKLPIFSLY